MAEAAQWGQTRPLAISDLVDALAAGIRDFRAAPRFGLLLAALSIAGGWLLMALLWHFGLPFLAYPLAMGFVLVAPFAVVGLYAVSDLLERGETPTWGRVLGAIRRAASGDLRWMAFVAGFSLVIWMDIAAFLFFGFIGFQGFDADFLRTVLTTPTGLLFLLLGNVSGAAIALAIFSISVVSFPMLYERNVDFVTAMVTSVRLVIANPATMIAWCALIGLLAVLSLLSLFLGLLVVLPVIGHATWHLYRRAIEPAVRTPPA